MKNQTNEEWKSDKGLGTAVVLVSDEPLVKELIIDITYEQCQEIECL